MPGTKRKAVISAERQDLEAVEELVRAGRYRTVSEFVREALHEKLERLRRVRLAEEVTRYCEEHAEEDADLVAWQAFPRRSRRAKR